MNASRFFREARFVRLLPALAVGAAFLWSCAARGRTPVRSSVPRRQVAALAVSLAGLPYVYGGSDIDGFDCSGLVYYVYDCFGIRLPRSARGQSQLPGAVRLKRAVAGDILIFRLQKAWHSAIYLGDGRFVHAPSARGWVRVETLNDYWLQRLKTAIAVLGAAHPLEEP
jgi:cell wall-associated NlpC family hydrolase